MEFPSAFLRCLPVRRAARRVATRRCRPWWRAGRPACGGRPRVLAHGAGRVGDLARREYPSGVERGQVALAGVGPAHAARGLGLAERIQVLAHGLHALVTAGSRRAHARNRGARAEGRRSVVVHHLLGARVELAAKEFLIEPGFEDDEAVLLRGSEHGVLH